MNKQIKGLLYFYISDIRHSLMIFWSILLLVLVVSIAFAYYLIGVEDSMMAFGFPFAIYFYCLILGFMTVKESIPFAIKMGATRKNILISLAIFFLGLVVLKSIVASTIQEIVLLFTDATGITTFQFLHPAMMLEDTWLNRILIDVCIMFFLLSFMFIIGLLFYKYGFAGGGLVAGILAIATLFGVAKGWIYEFIVDVVTQMDMLFFYQVLGVGLLLFLLSNVFVRRITIEKRR
ncbi:hypothetical protein [Ornithinibacillus californiensis]|uniref:hypothetical protein n=1 Tax=Ornithinibacillus californiensis TaxID=161536 RepID=UPI00064DB4E9|nr:hypothetical protein [Ornithinibacillus californiensis]